MAQVLRRNGNGTQMLRQQQQQRTTVKPISQADINKYGLTALIKRQRNARPWVYYDTRFFSASVLAGETTAFNFAQWQQQQTFFQHTSGVHGEAVTSMSDSNKMDADFICTSISVDIFCTTDVLPTVVGGVTMATAPAFVETLVYATIARIRFNQDTEVMIPITDLPAGGGVSHDVKNFALALPSNESRGHANNGLPTCTATKTLGEPIFFKMGQPFTFDLLTPQTSTAAAGSGPLGLLQALTPLVVNGGFAGVKVKLQGVRGKPLMVATPG